MYFRGPHLKTCVCTYVHTNTHRLQQDRHYVRCVQYLACCCCCSVAQSCPTLCNPMDCSVPHLPVPHHLPKFARIHFHCISDAIQPSHHLIPSSPSALNLSQHPNLLQPPPDSFQARKTLSWPKSSFGVSVKCCGKIRMNFWVSPLFAEGFAGED